MPTHTAQIQRDLLLPLSLHHTHLSVIHTAQDRQTVVNKVPQRWTVEVLNKWLKPQSSRLDPAGPSQLDHQSIIVSSLLNT